MELNTGIIIASAMIFTWVGYFFSKTKDSKTLLSNSAAFNEIMIQLQEEIVNEIQTSQRERGKMLLNQEKIDKMVEENNILNLEIKQTLEENINTIAEAKSTNTNQYSSKKR